MDIDIIDGMETEVLFQYLYTDMRGVNNLDLDAAGCLLILNHAVHAVIAGFTIQGDVYASVSSHDDRGVHLEVAYCHNIVVIIVRE